MAGTDRESFFVRLLLACAPNEDIPEVLEPPVSPWEKCPDIGEKSVIILVVSRGDIPEAGALIGPVTFIDDRKADFIQAARHEQQDYVPYVITEVNLKRTIELEYRKMPVIYEVINNGLCESYKVSLLSDVKEEMSQEEKEAEFKKFCAKVLQFVKFLDEPTGY